MTMHKLKPCPFCGYKIARVSARQKEIRRGQYCGEDFTVESVLKISANVMCNRCHAKGGTAVGFIAGGLFRPSEKMKQDYNVEPLENIWKRAADKWNRRTEK